MCECLYGIPEEGDEMIELKATENKAKPGRKTSATRINSGRVVVMNVSWTAVRSKVISRVSFYKSGKEPGLLGIEFKSGKKYVYKDVDWRIFSELSNVKSVGQFYNAEIKGKYESYRMTKGTLEPVT